VTHALTDTHWSGAKHRLDRDLTRHFASDAYAMEQLVAELGAAFLCAALGSAAEPSETTPATSPPG
jgi:antirestriction protein ArdC